MKKLELYKKRKWARNHNDNDAALDDINPVIEKVNELVDYTSSIDYVRILPATIEPNKILLYDGELWRGLRADESDLAEGTPWPVKGYKEYVANLYQSAGLIPATYIVYKNTIGVLPDFVKQEVGHYLLNLHGCVHHTAGIWASVSSYNHNAGAVPICTFILSVHTSQTPPALWLVAHDENGAMAEDNFHAYLQIRVYPKFNQLI
jgi:hypothetical protein